ncbi:D-alanyl-D-alanine carboxypeptidase family protein [Lentzea terrae]|uniref:D-alanyl-D-alanine carboxypeptidase family protein n=1 Tax=Lentzea terrae TaxID=2200761 RepID=UPI00130073AF|nr:D-alanyl-D-alanine carboxypeptidase family protein [Lentzea terrae]
MKPLSASEIAQHAYDAGFRGQALKTAVAIALAESGGRADAKGDTGITDGKWGPSVGLWQIRSLHKQTGTGGERDVKANTDPAVNAKHAWSISKHGTYWTPWSVYLNGSYRQHLDEAGAAAKKVNEDRPSKTDRKKAQQRGSDRVVLDLNELRTLETFFKEGSDRVRHVRRTVTDVEQDLEPARAALPDPALAALIQQTFKFLASPSSLPRAEERLDWHAAFAARVRRLAEAADGPDNRWTRGDAMRFVTKSGDRLDRGERAVLEALIVGAVVRRHSGLKAHVQAHQDKKPAKPQQADTKNLRNGHVPAGKLQSVGDNAKMLEPAARQFRRMDAAARAAGLDLEVRSGYRGEAEQAGLYQKYLDGKGNLAAPPGRSTHGLGLSADINVLANPKVLPWLRAHADEYGFVNDVPSEPWHWTYKHR